MSRRYILVVLVALIFAGVVLSNRAGESLDMETHTSVQPEIPSATIDLSGRELTEVPTYVFQRLSVVSLDLSHNQLDGALPAEVRHLQKLRVLNLSNNNFTGLPAEIGQLAELEVLDVSNNQLTGLPHELGNLKNLKILNLKGNDYSTFDLEIIMQSLPSTVEVVGE